MTTNRWRGDAPAREKIIYIYQPPNTESNTRVTFTVGNKVLTFDGWSSSAIVSAINAAAFPELDDVSVEASGDDIRFTGTEDEDFDVSVAISPTVEFEVDQGRPVVNQQTRLSFNGATGGTFTVTANGETTSAISLKTSGSLNTGGVVTAINALASFTSGDVTAVASGTDIVLTWAGNFAGTPVAVLMTATGLNNGGSVVIGETQAARPATNDIWHMGTEADFEFNISDGTTAVTLRSNETDELVAAKLSAAWGGDVEVISDLDGTGGIQPRYWILNMIGFPGTTTTLSVASIGPTETPAGVAIEKKYDRTDTLPSELLLVDSRAGAISITYKGTTISDFSSITAVITSLNAADQFTEWTGTKGEIIDSAFTGDRVAVDTLHFLEYISSADRIAGSGAPGTYGGEDFNEAEVTVTAADGGVLHHLQHGGTTNAATSAIHYWYHAPNTRGNTLSGSYSLTFPEGLATFAHNDSAATVKSTVETAIGYTVAVTGTGSAESPYILTYTSDTATRELPTLESKAFTGDGTGVVSRAVTAQTGKSATQIVRVPPFADSGTYELRYGSVAGPVQFDYDEDATSFKTKLETYPELSTTGDTAVAFNADSGEYVITFQGGLANQIVDTFSVRVNSLASSTSGTAQKIITQLATGPKNFAEPLNWSRGYVPNSGEEIVIDSSRNAINYGLRQFGAVTIDTSTNTITATNGHDLTAGQVVQFVFGSVAPTGVAVSTDYYVTNVDHVAGTFKISTTENGAAVNITAAGTGPHYCGLIPSSVLIPSSMTQGIGRRRDNAAVYDEYLEQYLCVGIGSGDLIEIGKGSGTGSGLLRINTGNSAGQITVHKTGASTVTGYPAFIWDAFTDSGTLLVHRGTVGVAVYDDETAKVGAFNVLGGTLTIGSATVVDNAIAATGTLKAQRVSVEGLLRIT